MTGWQCFEGDRHCCGHGTTALPQLRGPTLKAITPAASTDSTLIKANSPARLGEGNELMNLIVPCQVILPSTYTSRITLLTSTMIGASQLPHARISTCKGISMTQHSGASVLVQNSVQLDSKPRRPAESGRALVHDDGVR